MTSFSTVHTIYLVKSQRTGFSSDQSLSLLSSLFVRANLNFGIPYDWLEMKTVAKFHLLRMHKIFIICYPTFLTLSGRFLMNFVQKLGGFFCLKYDACMIAFVITNHIVYWSLFTVEIVMHYLWNKKSIILFGQNCQFWFLCANS